MTHKKYIGGNALGNNGNGRYISWKSIVGVALIPIILTLATMTYANIQKDIEKKADQVYVDALKEELERYIKMTGDKMDRFEIKLDNNWHTIIDHDRGRLHSERIGK